MWFREPHTLRAVLLSWLYNPQGIKRQAKKNHPTLMLPTPHSNYDIALHHFSAQREQQHAMIFPWKSAQEKSCPIIWPIFYPWWWISPSRDCCFPSILGHSLCSVLSSLSVFIWFPFTQSFTSVFKAELGLGLSNWDLSLSFHFVWFNAYLNLNEYSYLGQSNRWN